MALADELLLPITQALDGREPPRVRALHLPPRPWNGSKDGEFGAIELDSGALGLSYLLLDDTLAAIDDAGAGIAGADALALARLWTPGETPARAALGFAALNALTRDLLDRAGWQPPDAPDSIGGLDPRPGEPIGMVGYFPPLARQVVARGARLTVLELRSDLAGERDGFTITADANRLAGCTQVLCTSTVLLNHTVDRILEACRAATRFVLLGPGAGCAPDPLFARGVTAIGGTWIDDPGRFVRALAAGERWSEAARKVLVERERWPGMPAILDRARRRGSR